MMYGLMIKQVGYLEKAMTEKNDKEEEKKKKTQDELALEEEIKRKIEELRNRDPFIYR